MGAISQQSARLVPRLVFGNGLAQTQPSPAEQTFRFLHEGGHEVVGEESTILFALSPMPCQPHHSHKPVGTGVLDSPSPKNKSPDEYSSGGVEVLGDPRTLFQKGSWQGAGTASLPEFEAEPQYIHSSNNLVKLSLQPRKVSAAARRVWAISFLWGWILSERTARSITFLGVSSGSISSTASAL